MGRLLLFRYFDFSIEPGNAYRYRVKLKMRNPNYLRGYDEVVDQSVAEMGSMATQLLIKLVSGKALDKTLYKVPTKLIIRSSCKQVA